MDGELELHGSAPLRKKSLFPGHLGRANPFPLLEGCLCQLRLFEGGWNAAARDERLIDETEDYDPKPSLSNGSVPIFAAFCGRPDISPAGNGLQLAVNHLSPPALARAPAAPRTPNRPMEVAAASFREAFSPAAQGVLAQSNVRPVRISLSAWMLTFKHQGVHLSSPPAAAARQRLCTVC
jgi:hypothetical protein